MIDFSTASLETLIAKGGHDCACGRHHAMNMDYLRIESGAASTSSPTSMPWAA